MQNHFAGDIGDYLKLGILRALSPGYRLGVAWWLHPDESDGNGQHVGYIHRAGQWRHFDPALFDALHRIVMSGQRNVQALAAAGLLPGAMFHDGLVPTGGPNRQAARRDWFRTVVATLSDADLVFVDPDNGLEPNGFRHGAAKSGKSVQLSELHGLARPDRCLVVYHHQTRRAGGHLAEILHWLERLRDEGFRTVDALRCKPYSPRVFFLLNAPEVIRQRAARIEAGWHPCITWHPGNRVASHDAIPPSQIDPPPLVWNDNSGLSPERPTMVQHRP